MPVFYFDIRDGDSFTPDDTGFVLRDLEAAQKEAATALAEMARDVVQHESRVIRGKAIADPNIEIIDRHCCVISPIAFTLIRT